MSEAEAYHRCNNCDDNTLHMFSGSLTKGQCLICGNRLPEDDKADMTKVVSYNG